jgi:hypothetical protein
MTDAQVQSEVMEVLQAMFPKVTIPKPTAFLFQRWFSDPLYRGSYSTGHRASSRSTPSIWVRLLAPSFLQEKQQVRGTLVCCCCSEMSVRCVLMTAGGRILARRIF